MANKKMGIVAVCVALALLVAVFGTIAYLSAVTDPATNTFTVGNLISDPDNFVVKEHLAVDEDGDGVYTLNTGTEVDGNSYTVLPGVALPKDPFIATLEELKMDAYVFVEVKDTTGSSLNVVVDSDKWVLISGVTGPQGGQVYAMKANDGIVAAGDKLGPITILKNDTVTVNNDEVSDAGSQFGGSVTFYGYMIQKGNFANATAAWMGAYGATGTTSA